MINLKNGSKDFINIFVLLIVLGLLFYFYKKNDNMFIDRMNRDTTNNYVNNRNDYTNIIKKHLPKKEINNIIKPKVVKKEINSNMNKLFVTGKEMKTREAYLTKMNNKYNDERSLQDEVTTISLVPPVVY